MQYWDCFCRPWPSRSPRNRITSATGPRAALRRRWARRCAEHFVTSPHQHNPGTIFYGEVGTWYGALTFAELTHDTDLRDRLIKKFDPLMPGGAEGALIPKRDHVDDSIFGIVPLEIDIQTKDKKYLDYGLSYADRQWVDPTPDGLSHETRFWIDDMYMLTILQLQAYRATGDKKYLDRDANRDGGLSRQAAAAQRPLLPRARCAVLLGPRRWMGCCRHGGDAA